MMPITNSKIIPLSLNKIGSRIRAKYENYRAASPRFTSDSMDRSFQTMQKPSPSRRAGRESPEPPVNEAVRQTSDSPYMYKIAYSYGHFNIFFVVFHDFKAGSNPIVHKKFRISGFFRVNKPLFHFLRFGGFEKNFHGPGRFYRRFSQESIHIFGGQAGLHFPTNCHILDLSKNMPMRLRGAA